MDETHYLGGQHAQGLMVDQLIVFAQRDYLTEPVGLGSIREHPRNKGKRSYDRS
jgi:hypothetical protein